MREQYPIDYPVTAALGLPLLVFGILSIVVQRRAVGDQRRYITTSTGRGLATQSGRGAFAITLAYGFVTVAIPIVAIALVALSPFWNGDLGAIRFTRSTSATPSPTPSSGTRSSTRCGPRSWLPRSSCPSGSSRLSRSAASSGRPGWSARAWTSSSSRRSRSLGRSWAWPCCSSSSSRRSRCTARLLLFVIGYAFVILPFSLRSQYNSLIGVHASLFEASRVCGASQLRMILSIALPDRPAGDGGRAGARVHPALERLRRVRDAPHTRQPGAGHAALREERPGPRAGRRCPRADHDRSHHLDPAPDHPHRRQSPV